MKIRYTIPLLIATCLLISCNGKSNKSSDPIVYAPSEDHELEKAKQEALSKLDYFINSFNVHSNDTVYQYSLKVDFMENGNHEHMWISLNSIENGQFIGHLGNEPQIIINMKIGDSVRITKDQIEDWMIYQTNSNNFEGGYSAKVLEDRQK